MTDAIASPDASRRDGATIVPSKNEADAATDAESFTAAPSTAAPSSGRADNDRSGPVDQDDGAVTGVARKIALFVAPASLITAMLYYFGWVRTAAVADVLGINDSMLVMTTQDYLLRSVSPLYVPIGVAVVTVLAATQIHHLVWERLDNTPPDPTMLRVLGQSMVITGWVVLTWGVLRLPDVTTDRPRYLTPVLLGGGAFLIGYGSLFIAKFPHRGRATDVPKSVLAMATAVAVVGLFTATFLYANAEGTAQANETIANITKRPNATILSKFRLQLPSAEVREEILSGGVDGDYRYRYGGLRMLTRNGEYLFLAPESYSAGHRVVVVVPTDGVRVDFGVA